MYINLLLLDVNKLKIHVLEKSKNSIFGLYSHALYFFLNFKTQESRQITHLQYTSWPDHGTPNPLELLSFYHYVLRAMEQHLEQKIVVHCRFDVIYIESFSLHNIQ